LINRRIELLDSHLFDCNAFRSSNGDVATSLTRTFHTSRSCSLRAPGTDSVRWIASKYLVADLTAHAHERVPEADQCGDAL
jgi:hypothetical protein